jgi:hypothetical protein
LKINREGYPCLLSSGAPDSLVRHRTVTVDGPVPIAFLFWHRRPLQLWAGWRTGHCPVHTGQSGAPRRPLELPRVARRLRGRPLAQTSVGADDRWLTGQSSAPPNSPVNFSRTPLILFPRATSSPRMTHRTVRCTTRQSGEL